MSYSPPGRVAADFRPDNESLPVHHRWRLGPGGPITVGDLADSNGTPLIHIVDHSDGSFVRVDFLVGAPYAPHDASPPTAGGMSPVGADLIVDCLKSTDNGVTYNSVFGGDTTKMFRLPAGLASPAYSNFVVGPSVEFNDYLKLHVVQVGSTQPGQNILLTLLGWFIVD
jgi:hypothetical protein